LLVSMKSGDAFRQRQQRMELLERKGQSGADVESSPNAPELMSPRSQARHESVRAEGAAAAVAATVPQIKIPQHVLAPSTAATTNAGVPKTVSSTSSEQTQEVAASAQDTPREESSSTKDPVSSDGVTKQEESSDLLANAIAEAENASAPEGQQ